VGVEESDVVIRALTDSALELGGVIAALLIALGLIWAAITRSFN
jgi:hypothetical protein